MKYLCSALIALALIISIPKSTCAQSITWGVEAKANKATGLVYSLGWHEGFYYTLERDGPSAMKTGSRLRFEKLSKNMSLVSSKSLDVEFFSNNPAKFQIVDGKLKIYSMQSGGFKETAIFCDTYSLEGEKLDRVEIAKVSSDNCAGFPLSESQISFSPNKKHVVWSTVCELDNENLYEFRTITFDQNGENIQKHTTKFTPEGKLTSVEIRQVEIDDKGHAIISYYVSEKKPIQYFRAFLVLNGEGEVIINKKLNFDNFFLGKITLKLSNDRDVYLTGQVGTEEDGKSTYGGFFVAKLDSLTYEIDKFQSFPYTEEFFLGLGYKVKSDGRVKFHGVYSLDIILNDKGGGFLVANHKESYRSTGITDKELVVLPFSNDLIMEAPMVVPRSLNSYPPLLNGLGYLGFCKGNKLYLVYTDHVKNINEQSLDDMQSVDNPKDGKAAIYIATIEPGTSVKRKIISRENKIKGYLIPGKSNADQENYILNVGNKSKVLYGRIKF